MTLREVRREIRSRGSVKTLWDTLYGWSMHVGSAQAGLPDRVTSARLLRGAVERKRRTGWQKEKKSSSVRVTVGVYLKSGGGPSIPALLDRVTVGRGSYTQLDIRAA